MKKKLEETEQDLDNDLLGGSPRPTRNRGNTRNNASHSSNKRKRAKAASRKGNASGGMHQRGDKRVVR